MIARLTLILMLTITTVFASTVVFYAADEAVDRIGEAKTTFQEIMAAPDKGIPTDLIAKAHCIVIIPAAKRGGFVVGGQYGKGVATCRQADRTGWTGVSTVRMEGGSFGLRIGGGESDIVMMVMNETGANKLMKSEFTLGGEGAVMAGPVGRAATAETDAYMRAEILSWSRSRGLFAGAVVKGSTLRSDDKDNEKIYGKPVKHEDILHGRVPAPTASASLAALLGQYSNTERNSSNQAPGGSAKD